MGEKVVTNPNCVTTFESYSIDYEWRISQVRGRISKSEALVCPDKLKSPPGKDPSTTWRLEALQHTTTEQAHSCGYNVTVTLTSCSYAMIWASVRLEIKVKSSRTGYCSNYLSTSPRCIPPQTLQICAGSNFTGVIPHQYLQQYISGEDLIIHCHIFVNKLEQPVHVVNIPANEIQTPTFDLCRLMEDARHNDYYTDVTLVTDGKQFKAHKVVLAIQSSVFEKHRAKDDGNEIDMLDVPADTMDTILTYMYTGKVVNIDKKAYDLLPRAVKYDMEGLKTMCEEALTKSLTAQTAIDVLLLANRHSAQNLKESCLTFIASNITEVKKSSAWGVWAEEKPKEGANKDLWVEVLEYTVRSL